MSDTEKNNFKIPRGDNQYENHPTIQQLSTGRAFHDVEVAQTPKQSSFNNAGTSADIDGQQVFSSAQDGFSHQPESYSDSPSSIFDQHYVQHQTDKTVPAEHSNVRGEVRYKPKKRRSPLSSVFLIIFIVAVFFVAAYALRT